jgi:hypothetical protein
LISSVRLVTCCSTNLKGEDLSGSIGKRAQRGLKLPRGFQNVDTIHAFVEREPRSQGEIVM